MYYGRLPATNPTQLQAMLDKTLMYDQFTMPDPSYLGEVVMIAGVDGSFGQVWANGQINYGTSLLLQRGPRHPEPHLPLPGVRRAGGRHRPERERRCRLRELHGARQPDQLVGSDLHAGQRQRPAEHEPVLPRGRQLLPRRLLPDPRVLRRDLAPRRRTRARSATSAAPTTPTGTRTTGGASATGTVVEYPTYDRRTARRL